MFFKEKFDALGNFIKMKARLVAGGNFVDTSLIGETRAPTINAISVMLMLNIASIRCLNISTADVSGAFLIPDVGGKEEDVQYVYLEKDIASQFVKIKTE